MTIAELKIDLIAKIIATNDEALLIKIKNKMDSYNFDSIINEPMTTYHKESTEEVYILNDQQLKRIDIAKKQFENGNYLTEEEAEKEMQKWFNEEKERLIGH